MLSINITPRLVTTSSHSPTQGLVAWWVDHCFTTNWPLFFNRLTIVFQLIVIYFLSHFICSFSFLSFLYLVGWPLFFIGLNWCQLRIVQWQRLNAGFKLYSWKVDHCLYFQPNKNRIPSRPLVDLWQSHQSQGELVFLTVLKMLNFDIFCQIPRKIDVLGFSSSNICIWGANQCEGGGGAAVRQVLIRRRGAWVFLWQV